MPHPTQKPEGLIERMVLASSNVGERVLDPFAGSGTTLRVCQQLGRESIGIELSAPYVAEIQKRLAEPFTGFDSIDPRMKRIPRDLRDPKIRAEYIENHQQWFLQYHEDQIDEFEKTLAEMYPPKKNSFRQRTMFPTE